MEEASSNTTNALTKSWVGERGFSNRPCRTAVEITTCLRDLPGLMAIYDPDTRAFEVISPESTIALVREIV